MRLLITGFEPGRNVRKTPSGDLAKMWADGDMTPPGVEVRAVVVPQVFKRCTQATCVEIEAFSPDVVLMYGATPKNDVVRIERFAINVEETSMGDNTGIPVADRPVVPGGPAAYETTLPYRVLLAALDAVQIRGRLSYNAGTHTCNSQFYAVRHYLETTGRAHVLAGFVHVPFPAEYGNGVLDDEAGVMTFAELRRASVALAEALAAG